MGSVVKVSCLQEKGGPSRVPPPAFSIATKARAFLLTGKLQKTLENQPVSGIMSWENLSAMLELSRFRYRGKPLLISGEVREN